MKKRLMLLIYIGMCMLLATACAPQDEENNGMDYDQTKKMVVDILKTDEGKKAVEAIMKDPSVRQDILMDQNAIKAWNFGKKPWMIRSLLKALLKVWKKKIRRSSNN
jgi:hypothetical protein